MAKGLHDVGLLEICCLLVAVLAIAGLIIFTDVR